MAKAKAASIIEGASKRPRFLGSLPQLWQTRGVANTGQAPCFFIMEPIFTLLEYLGIVILISVSLGGFAASMAWVFALLVDKKS